MKHTQVFLSIVFVVIYLQTINNPVIGDIKPPPFPTITPCLNFNCLFPTPTSTPTPPPLIELCSCSFLTKECEGTCIPPKICVVDTWAPPFLHLGSCFCADPSSFDDKYRSNNFDTKCPDITPPPPPPTPTPCIEEGDPGCDTIPCCDGLICHIGYCFPTPTPTPCKKVGQSCNDTSECCFDYECIPAPIEKKCYVPEEEEPTPSPTPGCGNWIIEQDLGEECDPPGFPECPNHINCTDNCKCPRLT